MLKWAGNFIEWLWNKLHPNKPVVDLLYQTPEKPIKTESPIPETTTSKDGEHLTKYEFKKMISHPDGFLHCPDCGGKLAGGPEGGGSQNMACEDCFSEFNMHGFSAKRISDKGPRSIGNRAWCYGFTCDTFFDQLNNDLHEGLDGYQNDLNRRSE